MMGLATKIAVVGLALGANASVAPPKGNGTVYTTEIVTALTTYCPAATTITHGDKTYTVTKPTTLTITDCPCTLTKPVKPTATGPAQDACASDCYNAYDKCRTGPGANMATCAAKFAECLGYSPFDSEGSFVIPSVCSKKPAATTPSKVYYTTEVVTAITTYCPVPTTYTYNNKTITISKPTTLTITDCPCTVKKPSPSSPAAGNCASDCTTAYNKCRVKSGANMATCAAEYAQCLGFSPFNNEGTIVTPTACSPDAPGTTAPSKPTGTSPSSGNRITTPGSGNKITTPGAPGAPGKPGKPTGTAPGAAATPPSSGKKITTPGAPGKPGKPTGTTPGAAATPTRAVGGAAQIAPAGLAIALGVLALL